MTDLIDGAALEIVTITAAAARRVAQAYARWGKGVSPAGLNFGDGFAYDVAMQHDCGLLCVGDFSRTDVERTSNIGAGGGSLPPSRNPRRGGGPNGRRGRG